ncbi:LuxR C-terminal-related transcriptional regulator [Intrasporangium chromatireducens]|nr:helix-turn-helix transcriptional regulator [Intrasporangium chromatireducens]
MAIGVDDAHLLDDMSAMVVHHLVSSCSVTVILAVRSGEAAPDPIVALWKSGLAERIELQELGEQEIAETLRSVLGGPVDAAAVAGLMSRSGGNMLILRELVTGALTHGTLRLEAGQWRIVGHLHPTPRLAELVEARLEGLTSRQREALEVVAFGEPLDPAELIRLGYGEVAESLERQGLLRTSTAGSFMAVWLGHPIYGEVLRERIPGLRAREVTRTLAESVESGGNLQPADVLRVATWRLVAGGGQPELMYRAAVEARWRYDFVLAERFARIAVERKAGFRAALLAAQLAGLRGDTRRADLELADLARQARTPTDHGVLALTRLDNYVIYAGSITEGLRIADEAARILPSSEMRDEVLARRGALLLGEEGPRAAVEDLEPLMDRATGRAFTWASMPAAYSLARMGRFEESLAVARRGYRTQRELAQPADWYPFMHVFYECEALAHSGQLNDAVRLATDSYREGVDFGSLEQQGIFSWQLGKTVAARGHVTQAVTQLGTAISIYRRLGRPRFTQFSYIYLALAHAIGGCPRDAELALAEVDHLGVDPSFFMGVDFIISQGWTDAAAGNHRRAHERFAEAAIQGERVGDLVGATAALHASARVGYARLVAERLEALTRSVDGPLGATRAGHARSLAEADPIGLAAASEAFEQMGALLLAAEAAADSAVCWARSKDQRARLSAELRAATLASRCSGAHTPALRQVESRVRLTLAELEAAQLAASGLSNREIADSLVVSVRTVENRLQQVYTKFGIRSRRELADALSYIGDAEDAAGV